MSSRNSLIQNFVVAVAHENTFQGAYSKSPSFQRAIRDRKLAEAALLDARVTQAELAAFQRG